MAYSNTNRDNKQPERGFGLKKAAFACGLWLIIFSSLFNLYGKYTTLRDARARNAALKQKFEKIQAENRELTKQIEEATSSAQMDRKTREFLGLGSPDDVWLILPETENDLKYEVPVVVDEEKPTILMWWELFTKR